MKRVSISEHGRLVCWKQHKQKPEDSLKQVFLSEKHFRRLQRFDFSQQRENKEIFTWYTDHAKARQWVGVVQIPGLQVEILPKIDQPGTPSTESNKDEIHDIRQNLIYMLSQSANIPLRERDSAKLSLQKAPISEQLAALFARNLLRELLNGKERSYVEKEENLRSFKGKLKIGPHIQHNTGHRERFFCRFEELSEDIWLNRIFKFTCNLLLRLNHLPKTQELLSNCLLVLEEVEDVNIQYHHFEKVQLTRQNHRFQELVEFCRMVILGLTPILSSGKVETFSLLYDMNRVFETFIAVFLQKFVLKEYPELKLTPQGKGTKQYLMKNLDRGVLQLKPDILISDHCNNKLIIDTKWKPMGGDVQYKKQISAADLYQLHAYTQRYGCAKSIILFPEMTGTIAQDFSILNENNEPSERSVCSRYVNMNRPLYKNQQARLDLATELKKMILDLNIFPIETAA